MQDVEYIKQLVRTELGRDCEVFPKSVMVRFSVSLHTSDPDFFVQKPDIFYFGGFSVQDETPPAELATTGTYVFLKYKGFGSSILSRYQNALVLSPGNIFPSLFECVDDAKAGGSYSFQFTGWKIILK